MRNKILDILEKIEIPVYLFAIFVYPFLFIPFGLNYTDSPYHYLTYMGKQPAGIMVSLYAELGRAWVLFAGNSMMSFRLFYVLLFVFVHALPAMFVLGFQKPVKIKLRLIAFSVVLATAWLHYGLGWDEFSLLFLSLIFILSYYYQKEYSLVYIPFIGLFSALAVATRLPNIVLVVPVLFLVLSNAFLFQKDQKAGKAGMHVLIYLGSFALFYYVVSIFAGSSGSPSISLSGSANESSSLSTSTIDRLILAESSYTFRNLLMRYLLHSFQIIEMVGVLTLITVIWIYRNSLLIKTWVVNAALMTGLALYFVLFVLLSPYNYNLSFFSSALMLFLLGYLLHEALKKNDIKGVVFYLFILMLGFVSAAGSNTGLLKVAFTYSFMLPIVLFYVTKQLSSENKKGFYYLLIFILFFAFVHRTIIGKTYEDGRIWQLTSTVEHPKLRGIRTTELRKTQIEDIIFVVDSIGNNEPDADFLFYGSKSHLFHYLNESERPYAHPFWMRFDNKQQALRFGQHLESVEQKPYVFLIFGYPEEKAENDGMLIEKQLHHHNYRFHREGINYHLFVPNTGN